MILSQIPYNCHLRVVNIQRSTPFESDFRILYSYQTNLEHYVKIINQRNKHHRVYVFKKQHGTQLHNFPSRALVSTVFSLLNESWILIKSPLCRLKIILRLFQQLLLLKIHLRIIIEQIKKEGVWKKKGGS